MSPLKTQELPGLDEVFDRTEIVLNGFPVVLKYVKGCSKIFRWFIYIYIKSILKNVLRREFQTLTFLALGILSDFFRGEL